MRTYNATQILAPAASVMINVKVVEQHDKHNQHQHERAHTHQPPSPPERLATLKEADGVFEERGRNALREPSAGRDGRVGRVLTDAPPERVGRVQHRDAQHQADQEPADVGEVVQAGEQTQHERDDHIEGDEDEVLPGAAAVLPRVEQVEKRQRDDAEQRPRGTGGRDTRGGKVAAHDETEDAGAHVNQEEADRTNGALHVAAHGHLQQHVEADVDQTGVQEDGHNKPEPLVRFRALVDVAIVQRLRYAAKPA